MQKFFFLLLCMISGMRKEYTFIDRVSLNIGDKIDRSIFYCFVWIYQHSICLLYAVYFLYTHNS